MHPTVPDSVRVPVEAADQRTAATVEQQPGPSRSRLPAALAALVLVALSTVLVLVNAAVSDRISPLDEATHADYAYRLSHGEVPATGDVLAQEVLSEWACRGAVAGGPLPACGAARYDPAEFPAGGIQYNSSHPPLYYAVTGVLARAVTATTGLEFLSAARLLGVGWLSAGLLVLLATLRRLGSSWTAATAIGALVALTPSVLQASSTVNNDASALLAGAAVLWVTVRVVQGGGTTASSAVAVAAATVFVVACKVVFAVALVPALTVLLLRLLLRPAERGRLLAALAACAGSAVVAIGLWTAFQRSRGDRDAVNPVLGINSRPTDEPPIAATVRNLLEAWPPTARPFLEVGLTSNQLVFWTALTSLLFASAPLVGLAGARASTGRWLSVGTGLGMIAVPVVVEMYTFVTSAYYFPSIAPRYGLSLMAALAVALAVGVRGRWAALALAGVAVLGTAAVLTAVLELLP